MTIRTRLTLWYAGVLFISTLVVGGVVYFEFVVERRREARGDERTAAARPEAVDETQRSRQDAQWDEDTGDLLEIALCFALPAAVLGLAGGWWLTRKALAPMAALTQTAARVNEHHLREPLPRTNNGDELDRLTEVFNAMMARLDASFGRIREFTLHASHELKTPLTVVRGELESALQDPELAPAQRERCATQLEEVQRLAAIVDGLTLLTKADAGQVALAREPIRLDELVRDAFADAQILAQGRGIQVTLRDCEALTVMGDRNRLRQLLLNVTDNAIKYCNPAGQVTLALTKMAGLVAFTITNTGPGIAPELQSRVFDRFFRGDASHNDDIEGCGLGLSIAQWLVTAHGGSIRLTSEPGALTTVILSLPPATDGQPMHG